MEESFARVETKYMLTPAQEAATAPEGKVFKCWVPMDGLRQPGCAEPVL